MFWFWFNLIVHVFMFLVDVTWWVLAFRLTKNRFWRAVISVFMAVQVTALLMLHSPITWVMNSPKPFLVGVVVWHNLALGCGIVGLFVFAIIRASAWLRRRFAKTTPTPSTSPVAEPTNARSLARREFLGACVAAAPALFTIGVTAVSLKQLSSFRLRRMTLSVPTLPRALDGVTIAHVSDIHVGRMTCGHILRDLVKTTNDLHPDLVLLTGDLINYELSDLTEAMELVKAMPGRYGQCMIEGNHDLLDNGGEFHRRVKASGIPFLLNETSTITVRGYPVQFLGLSWKNAHGRKLDEIISQQLGGVMKQRQADAFPILLAHHPHAFDAAVAADLPLTLSGHTHGGQLMLNNQYGAGSVLFRYWSGLYARGNSQLVVSNGVGNMFPFRVNAPAELVHLTLQRADARG